MLPVAMRAGVILILVLTGVGCSSDGSVRVRSVEHEVMDAPRLPTAVYSSSDSSTADIFLTDLSPEDLYPGTDLSGVTGRIVHLHLFVVPLAGSTPMRDTACSVSVRHIVLAKGSIGVYSGGGYMNPTRTNGTDLAGSIRGATLRLTGQTAGFLDRLGPCTLDATFTAVRDESLARRIRARAGEVLSVADEKRSPAPAAINAAPAPP